MGTMDVWKSSLHKSGSEIILCEASSSALTVVGVPNSFLAHEVKCGGDSKFLYHAPNGCKLHIDVGV